MDINQNEDLDDFPEVWFNLGNGEVRWFAVGAAMQTRWEEYQEVLKHLLPNDQELMRRWKRNQLCQFVQRQLKKNGYRKHPFHEFGTEEYLMQRYPWMLEAWKAHQIRKAPFIPFPQDLRRRWWGGKRHDFLCRYIRGARNRYRVPNLRLNLFIRRLIWCPHVRCWRLRLIIFVPTILILFLLYLIFN